jgi:glycosyltransferase involved in cell wall biosynthesis
MSGPLGNGPRLSGAPAPAADRLLVMARRSPLVPPAERLLRLSVVLPVYNERATFREVVDRLLAKQLPGFEIEICLVESNSTDGTRDDVLAYADHPRVRLALEERPSGKGHAVRTGLTLATGDIVLIQDADLEYDLDDYEKLLTPIRDGEAVFVLGSRHSDAGAGALRMRQFSDATRTATMMNIGHLLFTFMLNCTFGQKWRDPFTMYKVFLRNAIHNVRFECNRFDFDLELVGKLVRQGFRAREIPVRYQSRSFGEGKKVRPFGDPPTWIKACLKHRFSTLHVWPESP